MARHTIRFLLRGTQTTVEGCYISKSNTDETLEALLQRFRALCHNDRSFRSFLVYLDNMVTIFDSAGNQLGMNDVISYPASIYIHYLAGAIPPADEARPPVPPADEARPPVPPADEARPPVPPADEARPPVPPFDHLELNPPTGISLQKSVVAGTTSTIAGATCIKAATKLAAKMGVKTARCVGGVGACFACVAVNSAIDGELSKKTITKGVAQGAICAATMLTPGGPLIWGAVLIANIGVDLYCDATMGNK